MFPTVSPAHEMVNGAGGIELWSCAARVDDRRNPENGQDTYWTILWFDPLLIIHRNAKITAAIQYLTSRILLAISLSL